MSSQSLFNIDYRSLNPTEKILSNLAHTPFSIEINKQRFTCQSVEGFWQGLKLEKEKREEVFNLYGFPAKFAGTGIKKESFVIAGLFYKTGSKEHETLIYNAVYEKVLQNNEVFDALKETKGNLIHNVPGKPLFKIDRILKSIYNDLFFLNK
jgi:hypothetical protein